MKKIVVFSLLLSMFVVSHAMALSLSPTDDAFVSRINPGVNYGTSPALMAYQVATSNVPTYLKFDLTGYSSFDSAVLWLYDYSSSGAAIVNAYTTTTNAWSEGTITYSNAPSRTTAFAPATIAGTGWVSWDVTSLANSFADDLLSLVLTSTGQINAQRFYSKEEVQNVALRPYLEVTETAAAAPVPEPSTILLFAGGLLGLGLYRRSRKQD